MDEDEDAEDATEVQLLRDAMVDARRCRQRCVCGLTGTDSIPACSSGWPCTVRGGIRVLDANEAISDMVAELRAELADLEES